MLRVQFKFNSYNSISKNPAWRTLKVNCKNCGNELSENTKFCPKCGTPVLTGEATVASEFTSNLKYAFWGERFVAWLIDIALIDFALLVLGVVFFWGAPFSLLNNGVGVWWSGLVNLSSSGAIFFLYWLFMEGAYGQSIGKRVMRLRVKRLDGKPITFVQSAIESVGKAFILPLDFLIGLFLYPKRRQRVFNFLSETVVVREQ
jgi:uncharacterized RDD family membrane protein YckC